jgi:hypothetical protein
MHGLFPALREVKPWVQRRREGDVRLVEGREEWRKDVDLSDYVG